MNTFPVNLSGRLTEQHINNSLSNIYNITFDITEKCDLNCSYCAFGPLYKDKGNRQARNLDVRKAYKLIDFVHEKLKNKNGLDNKRLLFIGFYGGEPLLCIDIIKAIVSYIESKDFDKSIIKYTITTNATNLKKHANYLVNKNFKLLLSLDGDRKGNSYIVYKNGKESFDTVIDNIEFIQKKYPIYFQERVDFNSVIHQQNDVKTVVEFIQKKFNKVPRTPGVTESGIEDCKQDEFDGLVRKNNQLDKDAVYKFIKGTSKTVFENYSDLFAKESIKRYYPTATCVPFSKKIHMTVDGKLYPCERTSRNLVMGEVSLSGVTIFYEQIINEINQIFDKIEPLCNKCDRQLFCQQCILRIDNSDSKFKCPDFSMGKLNEQVFFDKFQSTPELYKYFIEDYYVL